MTAERADGGTADGNSGDRVVSVFGTDIVLEEDFVTFPWRAGMRRAPLAFLATFGAVFLLVAIGGAGEGPFVDWFSLLGIVVYNAHSVPAATGQVPEAVAPVAETLIGVPVLGRALRGLFVVGPEHGQPVGHFLDVLGGESGEIGHVNFVQRQTETAVPPIVYYLVPVGVLVTAGYEFAASYWDRAATDSVLEVARFGLAIGVGYVVTMLLGTVLLTVEMVSPIVPGQSYLVLPDRYLTLVFGFVYPAVLATLGAGVVYVRREVLAGGSATASDDGGDEETVAAGE